MAIAFSIKEQSEKDGQLDFTRLNYNIKTI